MFDFAKVCNGLWMFVCYLFIINVLCWCFLETRDGFKNSFLKTGKFENIACALCQTPSPIRVLPLIQEGELFSLCYSVCYQSSSSWIRGGGRQAGGVWNFCLRVFRPSTVRVRPLIQATLCTHLFTFISFVNIFKIRNLKKLSLLKGDENFFPRKKFGGGS